MPMNHRAITCFAISFIAILFLMPALSFAHCDTMDGPVVKAAQQALKTRNVNFILIWVQKPDDAEVKKAFKQVLAVRRLNREARELADKYFFETVVRLHRAGEGESYTGLKPAGTTVALIIPILDKAIETGSAESLLTKLPAEARGDIQERFKQLIARKKFPVNDVEGGREYVKSYVSFIHFVEHLYEEHEPAIN